MANKNYINNLLTQENTDISSKKKSLHQHFNRLRDLGKFHPSSAIYIAFVDYEVALLNEIDFLGTKNEHADRCASLLENIIQAALKRDLTSFFQNFEEFIKESQDTKCYPRIKIAAISLGISLMCAGILFLALWTFAPAGPLFLMAVLITTFLTVAIIAITNYLLISTRYKPIFESEKKGDRLAEVIDKNNMGLRYPFFKQVPSELHTDLNVSIKPINLQRLPSNPPEYAAEEERKETLIKILFP